MSRARDLADGTFSGAFSADSPTLVVDATNNRVGVGETSPKTELNIAANNSGQGAKLTIENTDTSITTNDVIGQIDFYANDSSSNGTGAKVNIKAIATSTAGTATALTFGTSSSGSATAVEAARIDAVGDFRIGNTSGSWPGTDGIILQQGGVIQAAINSNPSLSLNRGVSNGNIAEFARSSTTVGSISVTTSSTSYNTSSDYRLKENVTELTGAIDRVKQVPVHRFNFIADPDKTVDGFLAHEVADVVPEAITGEKDAMKTEEYEVTPAVYEDVIIPAVLDDDGNEVEAERTEQRLVTEAVMGTREVIDPQSIDQSKLVPLLTAAIKEQQALIEDLQTRLAALEAV
jgi:hypothetical protein